MSVFNRKAKRILDIALVLGSSVFWVPMLCLLAILIRIRLGSPVLFRQKRPGFQCKPFILLKFRTMSESRNAEGHLLPDPERISAFGLFLRSSSLDELPELINVLRGDMSLVGPRPLLMEYLSRYNPEQERRHEVLPGITGWAQVNGRNALGWDEKFRLDVWYVDNYNLVIDIKILVLTLLKVIKREGINAEGNAPMPKFMGDKSP